MDKKPYMNDAHFAAISAKFHTNLHQHQKDFLRKMGDLIDTFEQETGEIIGAGVRFTNDEFKTEYSWNGEALVP